MIFLTGLLLFFLILGVGLTCANLLYLSKHFPLELPADLPLISVLIPARNEEKNIERCVRSVLASTYPNLEILVLDDQSTDGTGAILKGLAAEDPRLRVLASNNLPEGWIGKNWACHQLSLRAKGEYLLFLDADTQAMRDLPAYLLCNARRTHSDLLSGITRQVLDSFWPAIGIPFLYAGTLSFFPLGLLNRSWIRFGFANGQCMFFTRRAYDAIGGHAGVADHIVEDVALGFKIKRRGMNLVLVDLSRHLLCRMYTSFAEVWEGFSKNMYRLLHYPLLPLLVIIPHFLLWIFPWVWLVYDIVQHKNWAACLVPLSFVLIGLWPRFMTDFYFRHSLWLSWLNPLTILFIDCILLNSLRLHYHPLGVRWKGRRYKV